MNELFLKIVNMSISASWLVLAVLILRLVLKKAPKWCHVLLWGIVAVRLICPFSFESAWSLIPSKETIPMDIEMAASPAIDSGFYAINRVVNPVIDTMFAPVPYASANPLQIWIHILAIVWLIGIALLLAYTAISYWRLRRRVDTAVLYRGNIFQSESISSPFVLGIIQPRIYLPFQMEAQDFGHVIAHEQAHIRRKDHWWKPFGFLLLTIHWFNPLMWLAYVLLCRDIELACDESVIKALGSGQRADYTQALLTCSTGRSGIGACPLAFGEVGVKERVKSVMNYKKPAIWIILLSVVLCIVAAVCFLTNPKRDSFSLRIVVPAGSQGEVVYTNEEVSPLGNYMVVSTSDGLGDTEVSLQVVAAKTETAYDEPAYLTPGKPVKMAAEKGAWFKIGIRMQNPTDQDLEVYVNVTNVTVRIQSMAGSDRMQYYTPYIGDAPKVSAIAQILPYPTGYTYSSIALQTDTQPYGLTVYLKGKGTELEEHFENCAVEAFELIGNMDMIAFCKEGGETPMATFSRADREKQAKYALTIGAEDIYHIALSMSNLSGGCNNADGSPFKKGESILLSQLDGYTDLRGLRITASNEKGETVWTASIPDTEENRGFTRLTIDGWTIADIS